MLTNTQSIINQIKEQKKTHEVMQTGFPALDRMLDGGFYPKEIIVLGAFTGVGKSQVAGQIFYNIAMSGYKSAYFSLEISNEMILSRMTGMMSDIKPSRLRFGNLTKEEYAKKLKSEAKVLALGNLVQFSDNIYDIASMEKEIRDNKIEFAVIDFIQNIIDKIPNEYSRLSSIAIKLQKLAKETNCTILVLSQISNTASKEGRKSKNLEYKGSGSIAMVADLGLLLEKTTSDEEYNSTDGTELTIMKNRRGISGYTFRLGYQLPGGLVYEK